MEKASRLAETSGRPDLTTKRLAMCRLRSETINRQISVKVWSDESILSQLRLLLKEEGTISSVNGGSSVPSFETRMSKLKAWEGWSGSE